MSKKDDFVKKYKKHAKRDPATINKDDPKEIKQFVKDLKFHKLTSLFLEAVKEESENEDPCMGIGALFDHI